METAVGDSAGGRGSGAGERSARDDDITTGSGTEATGALGILTWEGGTETGTAEAGTAAAAETGQENGKPEDRRQ